MDDDELVADSMVVLLETRGFKVKVATDGQMALDCMANDGFDLVITDIVMAGMEGIEMIGHIRKASPSIPIIAMSGGGRTSTMSYLEAAVKLGANASIHKPFNDTELFEKIDRVMAETGPD